MKKDKNPPVRPRRPTLSELMLTQQYYGFVVQHLSKLHNERDALSTEISILEAALLDANGAYNKKRSP